MAQIPRHATEPDKPGEQPEEDQEPKLEPVGTVRRELISPTGHKVLVDVPVYPPFRLEGRPEKKPPRRPGKTLHRPGRERKPGSS